MLDEKILKFPLFSLNRYVNIIKDGDKLYGITRKGEQKLIDDKSIGDDIVYRSVKLNPNIKVLWNIADLIKKGNGAYLNADGEVIEYKKDTQGVIYTVEVEKIIKKEGVGLIVKLKRVKEPFIVDGSFKIGRYARVLKVKNFTFLMYFCDFPIRAKRIWV